MVKDTYGTDSALGDLYEIGERIPLGYVPEFMHAQLMRKSRYGDPKDAFQDEIVAVPEIASDEVLVHVMAAGVNFNNVWGATGKPVDLIREHNADRGDDEGFHIGGSDGSGIVWKVGDKVSNVKVGDEVVLHCGWMKADDKSWDAYGDLMAANSFRIWGHTTNWGSFAQFTRVKDFQCLPKPEHLSWAQAAVYMLDGATAYRMLWGWEPHTVRDGDVVLVWGGSGGLGSFAIQLTKYFGGRAVAVVSSEERGQYCVKELGAEGFVNRKDFNHWGRMPDCTDAEGNNTAAFLEWQQGARAFQKAIWKALGGERLSPRIVFEHPAQDTIPTSIFVADKFGMVVICAGTSGFNADFDVRYFWNPQVRFQGSHFANQEQCESFNELVVSKKIAPCLGQTVSYRDTGFAHQLLYDNQHPDGKIAILVGAKDDKEGRK